jgi:outer membrane protein insertion porin family
MRFFCCLVLLLTSFAVHAQTPNFRISDIRVEGLQRVSAGTVFSALPVRVGDSVNQSDIQNATRELFKVGFFADVAIQRDGDVLVLVLKERPAINKIELEGNKAIKSENLMDSLKTRHLGRHHPGLAARIYCTGPLRCDGENRNRRFTAQPSKSKSKN